METRTEHRLMGAARSMALAVLLAGTVACGLWASDDETPTTAVIVNATRYTLAVGFAWPNESARWASADDVYECVTRLPPGGVLRVIVPEGRVDDRDHAQLAIRDPSGPWWYIPIAPVKIDRHATTMLNIREAPQELGRSGT